MDRKEHPQTMYAIIGLGNPGSKYEGTRHNVGFDMIDHIANSYQIRIKQLKFKSLFGEGIIQGEKVLLIKPQTFMNLSGESVREIKKYYKLPDENIIVIYDDVSLDVGRIRIRPKGSDGGHNGMKSIIYQLNTDVFPRIRIGIGARPAQMDLANYVLGHFTSDEQKILAETQKRVEHVLPLLMKFGVSYAMNEVNGG